MGDSEAIPLSPQQVVLGLFDFNNTDKLSENYIVGVVVSLGCPNEPTARGVLARMVVDGELNYENLSGTDPVYIKPSHEA